MLLLFEQIIDDDGDDNELSISFSTNTKRHETFRIGGRWLLDYAIKFVRWQHRVVSNTLLLGSGEARQSGEKVICSGAMRERVVYTSQSNAVDVRTFATVVVAESSLAADGPRFIIRYDGKPAQLCDVKAVTTRQ